MKSVVVVYSKDDWLVASVEEVMDHMLDGARILNPAKSIGKLVSIGLSRDEAAEMLKG